MFCCLHFGLRHCNPEFCVDIVAHTVAVCGKFVEHLSQQQMLTLPEKIIMKRNHLVTKN